MEAAASSHMEHSAQKHGEPAQEQTHSITASCYDIYGISHDCIMAAAWPEPRLYRHVFPRVLIYLSNLTSKTQNTGASTISVYLWGFVTGFGLVEAI